MDTLLNDLFHAQPDALLMLTGILFIAIAIVGSIKTYIDPGKVGRIAAGAVGAVLLIAGLVMYQKQPQAPPDTTTAQAVAQSTAAQTASQPAAQPAAPQTTTACFVRKRWPVDLHKPMTVGQSCTLPDGQTGQAVLVNSFCTYTSGPLAGTTGEMGHLAYVGFLCKSPDKKSTGSVLPSH
jgi:hypothetical protein